MVERCNALRPAAAIAAALAFAAIIADASRADVWETANEWSEAWEERYAEWIEANVDTEFTAPVNLPVDCADICYAVRAVFAREHGLPYLASNRAGDFTGHFEDSWNHLPRAGNWTEDRRLRAFLVHLVGHVSTKSFPHDTYPVEITAETVKPGLVVYENLIASHASFIGRVNRDELIPVVFMEASVPPALRFKTSATTNVYIYPPGVPRHNSGIVRWKWPVFRNGAWGYPPSESMPHYSLEQYDPGFEHRKQISKALNLAVKKARTGDLDVKADSIRQLVRHFKNEIEFRASVVRKGTSLLDSKPGGFRSDSFEFNYSTDDRDQRLFSLLRLIWATLNEYDIPRGDFFEALSEHEIELAPDMPPISLFYLFIAVDRHWISPDAYVSLEERWGVRWDAAAGDWIFNGSMTRGEVLEMYQPVIDEGKPS